MKTNIKFYISCKLFEELKTKDFDNISISYLSKKSNISRSTFYNNFNNINEVLNYKLDIMIEDIIKLYKLNIIRKKENIYFYINLINYIEKNKDTFIIIKEKFFILFKEKIDNIFLKNINNKNKYFIKSGSLFNIISLYLENKIDESNLLNLLKQI